MHAPFARYIFLLIIFVELLSWNSLLPAQVPKILFEKYGVAEGLPESYVNSILQDDQGFIWCTTQAGLVKYDGYTFKTYKYPAQDTGPGQLNFRNVKGGIIQGENGIIWIGGLNGIEGGGLASFDPKMGQFTHHLKNSPLYSSLGSRYYLFGADLRANIWFSNYGGIPNRCLICRFNPHTDELSTYPCSNINFSGSGRPYGVSAMDSSIWVLDVDYNLLTYVTRLDSFVQFLPAGAVLPGTQVQDTLRGMCPDLHEMPLFYGDKGVYQWNPRERKVVRHYVQDPKKTGLLPPGKIKFGFEDQRGKYWVMNMGKDISVIDPQSGESASYRLGERELNFSHAPNDLINGKLLLSDHWGLIWTLNRQNGVFAGYIFYDFLTESFAYYDIHFNLRENPFRKDRYLPLFVLRDRSGLLWLGKAWDGLFRQAPKKQSMDLYKHDPNDENSLPSDWVFKILEDDQHRIWIATDKGLARYLPEQDHFLVFKHDPQNPNTLCDNVVNDLFQDADGRLWIATQYGLSRWVESSGTFERIIDRDPQAYRFCSLMEDKQGRIWVSALGKGVFVLNKQSGKIIKHYGPETKESHGLTTQEVSIIYQDTQGHIWMGDYFPNQHGLFRLNSSEDSFFHYHNLPNDTTSITNNQIRLIMEDSLNHLWLGTNGGGLYTYNVVEDRFVQYPDLFNIPSSPAYAKDDQGQLWIKPYIGGILAQLHASSGKITIHGEEKGMLSGGISSRVAETRLPIDPSGKVWVPLDNGLSVFDPGTQRFTNYFEKDGFQPYSFYYGGLASSDGQIWIGGNFGLNRIQPAKLLLKDSIPPQVHITAVGISDTTYKSPDGKIFTQTVSYSDKIQLNHDQNDLRFEFVALHYLRTEDNQYTWKLENYDENWTAPSLERKASYTNLDPGTYTFRVKASNVDGIWNEEGDALTIIIHPPWWATWWARGSFLALLLGLAYLIYRYQLNRQLEHAETIRLKELDTVKSRLYTNITHEFRTPLTVIRGMSRKIRSHPEEAEQMIFRNSNNLLRLVNQMLDLSKLESGKLTLSMVQGNVITYLRYLTESFQSYAASKNINLVFYTESEEVIMDYDAEKLQHIVSNLLSNAIKFSDHNSKIVLHVGQSQQAEAEQLIIRVKDQGIGIPPEVLPHIFDRFYQADDSSTRKGEGTGIGLTFTKELIGLLEGTIAVESQVNQGSTFIVNLPISRQEAKQEAEDTQAFPEIIPATPGSLPAAQAPFTREGLPLALIIEDNPDVTFYIKSCLEAQYQVITAENGKIGIEKALAHSPDLIISDVMMPEKDGFEVCHTLKRDERTSHIPIILLTARADVESRIAGLQEGADAYLAKPFEKKELLVRMEQLIQLRKTLQDRYRGRDLSPLPASTEDNTYQREDSFIRKVQLLIEGQLADPDFSIDKLARDLGMSRSQLFRKIKALTGKSVLLFVRSYRLGRARQLLMSTDLSVSEVAYEVGFKTPSHFSTSFLEEFGTQPSTFREEKS